MITLKTLPTATAQEVFDQVAQHLLTQGKKSSIIYDNGYKTDRCMYRAYGGLKCAAGCIISDEEYDPEWEDYSWCDLADEGMVPSVHQGLIEQLQRVHDSNPENEWEHELMQVAIVFGLEWRFN